jgi:hypothetical protein
MLDEDPVVWMRQLLQVPLYDLSVTHKDDTAVKLLNGLDGALYDCLGSIVSSHGINSYFHRFVLGKSDFFNFKNLAALVISTMRTNPVGHFDLAAFGTVALRGGL